MRDSVPSGSYSSVCNVLRQWQSRSSLLIESTDSMIHALINATCAGTGGSIDNPLTFYVGLIQLSFIPVCSLSTRIISVKLCLGFAL